MFGSGNQTFENVSKPTLKIKYLHTMYHPCNTGVSGKVFTSKGLGFSLPNDFTRIVIFGRLHLYPFGDLLSVDGLRLTLYDHC